MGIASKSWGRRKPRESPSFFYLLIVGLFGIFSALWEIFKVISIVLAFIAAVVVIAKELENFNGNTDKTDD